MKALEFEAFGDHSFKEFGSIERQSTSYKLAGNNRFNLKIGLFMQFE